MEQVIVAKNNLTKAYTSNKDKTELFMASRLCEKIMLLLFTIRISYCFTSVGL